MSYPKFPSGATKRTPEQAAALREKVDHGEVDALSAVAGPIINPLALNRAKRRKKHVRAPEQVNMLSLLGIAS